MLSQLKFQMQLKIIMLSAKSTATSSVYRRILCTWNSKKCERIHSDRKQIGGCPWILAEGGMDYKEAEGTFGRREAIVNSIMVMVSWVYTFVKTDKIVHSEYVQFLTPPSSCKINWRTSSSCPAPASAGDCCSLCCHLHVSHTVLFLNSVPKLVTVDCRVIRCYFEMWKEWKH